MRKDRLLFSTPDDKMTVKCRKKGVLLSSHKFQKLGSMEKGKMFTVWAGSESKTDPLSILEKNPQPWEKSGDEEG